jgi:hypothetical protein
MAIKPERFEKWWANQTKETGETYERDLLGYVKESVNLNKESGYSVILGAYEKDKVPYLPFWKAVELVKKLQPSDPTNPAKGFLKDLRLEVIDTLLNFSSEKIKENPKIKNFQVNLGSDEDRVKIFTAVGSPLDIYHGVDGFIEFEGKNGKKQIVTFDVSLDKLKMNKQPRANIILIGEVPDPTRGKNEEEKNKNTTKYFEVLNKIAQEVVEVLMSENPAKEQKFIEIEN